MSLLHDAGLLRCLKTSTPPSQTETASTTTEPLVLFFFFFVHFDFLRKSGWKKVALKIQSMILFSSFRQAKH